MQDKKIVMDSICKTKSTKREKLFYDKCDLRQFKGGESMSEIFLERMYVITEEYFKYLEKYKNIYLEIDKSTDVTDGVEDESDDGAEDRENEIPKKIYTKRFVIDEIKCKLEGYVMDELFTFTEKWDDLDLLVGVYFPEKYYETGDKITIEIGGQHVCEFDVNPGEIYKPLFNLYYIHLLQIKYHSVRIITKRNNEFIKYPYILLTVKLKGVIFPEYCWFPCPNGLRLHHEQHMSLKSQIDWEHPPCSIMDVIDKVKQKRLYMMTKYTYPYVYFSNMIKRHISKYIYLKKLKQVCGQIRAIPLIGVDYTNAYNNFNNSK